MDKLKVVVDGDAWCAVPERKRSPEVDFGVWWYIPGEADWGPHWRVSWIRDTGELYAIESKSHGPRRLVVLGKYRTRLGVERKMKRYIDPDFRLGPFKNRFARCDDVESVL